MRPGHRAAGAQAARCSCCGCTAACEPFRASAASWRGSPYRGLKRRRPQDPATLDELKELLAVVAAVRSEGMMVELRCGDLEERYRTRLLYAVSGGAGGARSI